MPGLRIDVVDVHVGKNIRIFRKKCGMSQTDLANKIGITFQQVQKYENGKNRVGSGRLFKIAEILKVPVSAFFDGTKQPADPRTGLTPTAMLAEPYALRLLQAFIALENTALRKSIAEFIETLPATSKRSASRTLLKRR